MRQRHILLAAICLLSSIKAGAEVIASLTHNPELLKVAQDNGWNSGDIIFTDEQAARLTNANFDERFPFWQNKSITSLAEFSYFTGVTQLKSAYGTTGQFQNCTSLRDITLPDGMQHIGAFCFSGCSSLQAITLPQKVSFVGDNCFFNCTSLTAITVASGNAAYANHDGDGVLYNFDKTTIICYPGGKSGDVYNVPSGVQTIAPSCFRNSKVKRVYLPATVTTIKDVAFASANLTELHFSSPQPPATVANDAFADDATQRVTIYVPKGATSAYRAKKQFQRFNNIVEEDTGSSTDDEEIANIMVNEPLILIARKAGWIAQSATKMTKADAAKVGSLANALYNNKEIEDFTAFQYFTGVDSIDTFDFRGCEKLTQITMPSSLKKINGYAFAECATLKTVQIPAGVTTLGVNPFINCQSLQSITVENGNTAFQSYEGVLFSIDRTTLLSYPNGKETSSYQMPNSVTTIEQEAFAYSKRLETVTIPNSVTTISFMSFAYCDKLREAKLPASMESISANPFSHCPSLTAVTVADGIQGFTSEDGVLFLNADYGTYTIKYLISYPAGKSTASYNIPSGTDVVYAYAFGGADKLTSVTLLSDLKKVWEYAFADCSSLAKVTSFITNPTNVINDQTFDDETFKTATLFVPKGYVNTYKATDGWKEFQTIAEYQTSPVIADNSTNGQLITLAKNRGWIASTASQMTQEDAEKVTNVQLAQAFSNGANLTSFDEFRYFTGVTRLAKNGSRGTFQGCSSLQKITLPPSIEAIEDQAFMNCTSLETITLPANVKTVGTQVFYGATKLKSISVASGSNSFTSADGVLYDKALTTLVAYPAAKDATSLIVPEGVATVATFAAFGATALKDLTLPATLTQIGNRAFDGCTALGSITVRMDTPPAIDYNCFPSTVYNNATLYIPAGTKTKYQSAANWRLFKNMKEPDLSQPIATIERNGALIRVARQAGWIGATDNQMTANQAAAVTTIGTLFANNTELTSFDEFQYFTGVKELAAINATGAFDGCTKLKSIRLPSGLTTIGDYAFFNCDALTELSIPATVRSISDRALYGAGNIEKYAVEQGSNYFTADLDGVLFNREKTTLVSYPAGRTATAYTIPTSVTTLTPLSFCYAQRLTAITIPAETRTIGTETFRNADKLRTVSVSWTTPPSYTETGTDQFGVDHSVFHANVYAQATLNVPTGTKATYSSRNYWSRFKNIVETGAVTADTDFTDESGNTYRLHKDLTATVSAIRQTAADVVIPATVSYSGADYTVAELGAAAFSSNVRYNSVTVPQSVVRVATTTFNNARVYAWLWNATAQLTAANVSSMKTSARNVLVYVNSTSQLATASMQTTAGVVVGTTAQTVELTDGTTADYGFYCPRAFTAATISYKRQVAMKSGYGGKSAGWATISLPFAPTTVAHATKGELTPFAAYTNGSPRKPYWLYRWTATGWTAATAIAANTPYLVSMPNNEAYDAQYNLSGQITYSATNATVSATPASYTSATYGGKQFLPAMTVHAQQEGLYAINSTTTTQTTVGGYDAGSAFISALRDVGPFEGYLLSTTAQARVVTVGDLFATTTTAIGEPPLADSAAASAEVSVYAANGQRVATVSRLQLPATLNTLPAGVYIVDGRKVVVGL